MTDAVIEELVARARNGDRAAWDEIVERYAALVWSVCRRYRLSDADAADIWGSVWLRLVESLDTLREPAALPGWLATTTARACARIYTSAKRQIPFADVELVEDRRSPAADDWLLTMERHAALRAAFAGLSERCREILSLLFSDDAPAYADAGIALGMPVGSIGPTRQRCLQSLRASRPLAALLDLPSRSGRSRS
jgi:RNA polymerase sigma factor (sigma-70 family)